MVSSSQKRLLCFVWIHPVMNIFNLDILSSGGLERQHSSPWDAEEMGTEGYYVHQAFSHRLSHSLIASLIPQTGCETSNGATQLKVRKFGNS